MRKKEDMTNNKDTLHTAFAKVRILSIVIRLCLFRLIVFP